MYKYTMYNIPEMTWVPITSTLTWSPKEVGPIRARIVVAIQLCTALDVL